MKMGLPWTVFLVVLALVSAESRVQKHRGLTVGQGVEVPERHPYLFLNVPRGRSGPVYQSIKVIEEAEDDESGNDEEPIENADDDVEDYDEEMTGKVQVGVIKAKFVKEDFEASENDDDDDEQNSEEPMNTTNKKMTSDSPMVILNAKPQEMIVPKEHAGSLMVPDDIIEIEGQRVVDEKTGKVSLLVPQAALDAIPDGSIVALMERSATSVAEDEEEARANRVIVRRRRLGVRRNVRRRVNGNVYRRRVNNVRRRQGNRRRVNRPIIYQI